MRVVIKNFNMTASEMERQWAEQDNYINLLENQLRESEEKVKKESQRVKMFRWKVIKKKVELNEKNSEIAKLKASLAWFILMQLESSASSLLTVSVQWLESEPRSEQQNSNPEVASKSAETKENSGKKSRHKSRRKSRGQEACRDLGLVNKDFPSVGSSESRASVKSTRIYTVENF